ncbi:MAG: hypothetical protein JWM68_3008 [Verrucomicrobiales bacterium]|nr:hypothetical protein [Verrucomicrobiales bacterium]
MDNTIPKHKATAIALVNQMIGGLEKRQAQLDIKQNTLDVMTLVRDRAVAAMIASDTAVATASELVGILNAADAELKDYLRDARCVLVHFLGSRWTQLWAATGFPKQSTAVPALSSSREVLAGALKKYFENNPQHQDPFLQVTAANADALKTRVGNARAAFAEATSDGRKKRIARDAAFAALRKRMRGLVTELQTVLEDDSAHWLAFGLNIPDSEATPDVPENVIAKPVTATLTDVKWKAPARASHYRVFQRIIGVDAEPVHVGSPADPDFMLENLPPASTVEITVSAVNDGGESAQSEPVTIVMPSVVPDAAMSPPGT